MIKDIYIVTKIGSRSITVGFDDVKSITLEDTYFDVYEYKVEYNSGAVEYVNYNYVVTRREIKDKK